MDQIWHWKQTFWIRTIYYSKTILKTNAPLVLKLRRFFRTRHIDYFYSQKCLSWRTSLLFIVMELAGIRSVAVAEGIVVAVALAVAVAVASTVAVAWLWLWVLMVLVLLSTHIRKFSGLPYAGIFVFKPKKLSQQNRSAVISWEFTLNWRVEVWYKNSFQGEYHEQVSITKFKFLPAKGRSIFLHL